MCSDAEKVVENRVENIRKCEIWDLKEHKKVEAVAFKKNSTI